jgi:hypothetical protein
VQSIFAIAACGSAAARFMLLISAMKKEQHASDIVLLFNGLTDELLLEEKFVTELKSTSSIAWRRECITDTRYMQSDLERPSKKSSWTTVLMAKLNTKNIFIMHNILTNCE